MNIDSPEQIIDITRAYLHGRGYSFEDIAADAYLYRDINFMCDIVELSSGRSKRLIEKSRRIGEMMKAIADSADKRKKHKSGHRTPAMEAFEKLFLVENGKHPIAPSLNKDVAKTASAHDVARSNYENASRKQPSPATLTKEARDALSEYSLAAIEIIKDLAINSLNPDVQFKAAEYLLAPFIRNTGEVSI